MEMAYSWNCSKGQIPIRDLAEFHRFGLERGSALNKITSVRPMTVGEVGAENTVALQPMPRTRMVLGTAQDS